MLYVVEYRHAMISGVSSRPPIRALGLDCHVSVFFFFFSSIFTGLAAPSQNALIPDECRVRGTKTREQSRKSAELQG